MLQKLHEDLKDSMKNKDVEKKEVLKMIIGLCNNEEKSKNRDKAPLKDDEIMDIIKSQIKQISEAIEDFEKGGRIDLVEKSNREIEILKSYLPQQLTEEQIAEIVKSKIKELSLDPNNIGIIMKHTMPEIGNRSNGNTVKKVVQQLIKG